MRLRSDGFFTEASVWSWCHALHQMVELRLSPMLHAARRITDTCLLLILDLISIAFSCYFYCYSILELHLISRHTETPSSFTRCFASLRKSTISCRRTSNAKPSEATRPWRDWHQTVNFKKIIYVRSLARLNTSRTTRCNHCNAETCVVCHSVLAFDLFFYT